MSQDVLLIHYQEVALKRGNRPRFIQQLVRNLEQAVSDLFPARVLRRSGRLLLPIPEKIPAQPLLERLRQVFGVANVALARRVQADLEIIRKVAGEMLLERQQQAPFATFRVATRRAFKTFPKTSMEVDREVGGHLKALTGVPVNLTHPEVTLHIEILPTEAFLYLEKHPGPGGLPVGSTGRVLCLLSGGIDSPVAAWRMMSRGCEVVFVHFHSYPFLSRTSQEKVQDLVGLLTRWQYASTLYLVPFGEIQREIVLQVPQAYRVVLYRRMMMRIASALARQEGAGALVTGESLGQVASQTLENLAVVEEAASLPLFRPLIGMNKEEIIRQAKDLGTYEIAIIPDQDCCQLFIPKHPVLRATLEEAREAEARLEIPRLLEMGLKATAVHHYTWPSPAP